MNETSSSGEARMIWYDDDESVTGTFVKIDISLKQK